MANHQTNFTSNFGEMGETGNAAFVLNVNGTNHTYHPIGFDVSVNVATVRRILATEPNLAQAIAVVLAAGGYPVLVYDGSEYGYIKTANNRYVFTCIDSINVVKQAEVDTQDGTITAGTSGVGGVSILARNESDLFLKITTVLTLGKVPIILDNGAYYHLVAKTGTLAQFARNTSSGTLQVISVDDNNQTTLSTFTFLESTGDASNTTSTFTKASGDTSTMTSGNKLSVIFSAISSFFASVLSALNNVKTKQTAVTDPTADGTGLSFIDSVTQNTNGEISPHKKSVQDGTTSQKGVVQLQDSIGPTESATDKAATPHAVKEAINTAVSSAYHAAGTKTVAQLTGSLLVAGNNGSVYNITDSGTTTSDFVDGAGHPINAGDNVGVCDIGGGVYKFDLLSGFVDLSNYLAKTGDGKDVTVSFSEASTRANIGTGEKLSVMFGKIKKWFTDLKALAFKDTVADSDISGTISDNHIASASTWNGKQESLGISESGDADKYLNQTGSFTIPTYLHTPRISNSTDANTLISSHTSRIVEEEATSTNNLPDNSNWWHLLSIQGYDNKYATQIALGMTTESVQYRRKYNNVWDSWLNMRDASWISSGVFGAARIPTSLPNVTAGYANAINTSGAKNGTSYLAVLAARDASSGSVYSVENLSAYYDTSNGGILIIGLSGGTKSTARSGHLRIGNGAYIGYLKADNITADRQLQMPDAGGTLALQNGTYPSLTAGHASALTPGGNAGQVLMSNGSGTDPSWGDIASAQTKHSDTITSGAGVVYYNSPADTFAIAINYDKANSRAHLTVNNVTGGRQIYVSLRHSGNLTPVPYGDNVMIASTLSEYNLIDLDILCMGIGDNLPVFSFTIAIHVNESKCTYTIYDRMLYHL